MREISYSMKEKPGFRQKFAKFVTVDPVYVTDEEGTRDITRPGVEINYAHALTNVKKRSNVSFKDTNDLFVVKRLGLISTCSIRKYLRSSWSSSKREGTRN